MPYDSPDTSRPNPMFVINPSQVTAVMKTVASLLTFAVFFFTTMVGFARDLDLNGALTFLQRDDVAKWISGIATFAYLAWRSRAAWIKKFREVILAEAAPDELAMLSTDLPVQKLPLFPRVDGRIGIGDPPSSRARETTTRTPRLVGREALGYPPVSEALSNYIRDLDLAPDHFDPLPDGFMDKIRNFNEAGPKIAVLPPGAELKMTAVPIGTGASADDALHIPVLDLRDFDRLRDESPPPVAPAAEPPEILPAAADVDRADTPVIS